MVHAWLKQTAQLSQASALPMLIAPLQAKHVSSTLVPHLEAILKKLLARPSPSGSSWSSSSASASLAASSAAFAALASAPPRALRPLLKLTTISAASEQALLKR